VPGRPSSHPFLAHDGVLAFAHRGGDEVAPENTMAAFEAAVELGFRYLETDIHCTRDGALVAFHDDRLDRVTDARGRVADMTLADIRGARIGGEHEIPLFEDLLDRWPWVHINVDPKSDRAVEPLIDLLRRTEALDRVCVGSFSGRRLLRMKQALGDRLCCSLGPLDVTRLRLASLWPAGWPRSIAAHCVQVPVRHFGIPVIDRRFIDAAHRHGLQVHAWTINDENEMTRLIDLGIDGLMTDRPALLRAVLDRRGLWRA